LIDTFVILLLNTTQTE